MNDETRLNRLLERTRLSKEEIFDRFNCQLPIIAKINRADYVIYNDLTKEELQKKVDILFGKLFSNKGN